MRALYSVVAGGFLAAGALVACGSDGSGTTRTPFDDDAAVDGEVPETGTRDGGSDSSTDARVPFDAAAPKIECGDTSPCITSLVAGESNFCATASDGVIRCWGDPGPLGSFATNGQDAEAPDPNLGSRPVVLTGLTDVVDIAINRQTCVVHGSGVVDCFGSSNPTPTPLANVSNAKKLALGDMRSCVVTKSDELFCWGYSYGWGTEDKTVPLPGEQAAAAAAGQAVAFAIGSKGTLYSWGSDARLIGRETPFSQTETFGAVTGIPTVLQILTSNNSAIALGTDGRLFGWGINGNGVLGLGTLISGPTPEEIHFDSTMWPSQVAMSVTHSCARMTDGSVWCWGATNKSGQLGYEAKEGVYVPTRVEGLKQNVASVAVGMFSTCVLLVDGHVQCWGQNALGQLGNGTRDDGRHFTPATVVFQ